MSQPEYIALLIETVVTDKGSVPDATPLFTADTQDEIHEMIEEYVRAEGDLEDDEIRIYIREGGRYHYAGTWAPGPYGSGPIY